MTSTAAAPLTTIEPPNSRRVLYGLGLIVVLSILYAIRLTNESQPYMPVFLAAAAISILILFWAGVEYTLDQAQALAAQLSQKTTREHVEQMAEDRQRFFNHIWQVLVDNRNSGGIPLSVLNELTTLFEADLVALWGAEEDAGFLLRAVGEVHHEHRLRLQKATQTSPCFDSLCRQQSQLIVTDIPGQTSKAFAWFCEELDIRQVILCPVLVRRSVVGVLAFFYRQNPRLCARQREEMQLAANLFLCAL